MSVLDGFEKDKGQDKETREAASGCDQSLKRRMPAKCRPCLQPPVSCGPFDNYLGQ